MNVLIVEDEQLAAENLVTELMKAEPGARVLGIIDTVRGTVDWLNTHPSPAIIFMDIQLADGLSFEIFSQTCVPCPVVFTTAFEEYAIRAFKVNSIDYVLKPVKASDISFALEKFRHYRTSRGISPPPGNFPVDKAMQMLGTPYKSRFLVRAGEHIRPVNAGDIHCVYSLGKATFLMDERGTGYDIAYSLEQMEQLLDPAYFFRINRKYIINSAAIKDIIAYSGSRMRVVLHKLNADDLIVSRSRVNDFKSWLDR